MSKLSLFEGRSRLCLLWIIIVLFFHQGELFAGITGKISGRVVDAKTMEAMPSVNIVIRGTSLGASSDIDGYYYIINIPPGNYTVAASMVGFETAVKTNVAVSSDHTTPLDFNLNPTVIEGVEVVVVAQREIVKKDLSSSQIVADDVQLKSVPMINDVMSYVNAQAGISGNDIRAGGLDQIGFMVDGLTMVDNRANRPLSQINFSTIAEISITKGGFQAEYGNIRSGLINIVTKDPSSEKYHASFDGRFTPARLKHDGDPITSPNNFYNRPFLDPAVCWTGIQGGTWDSLQKAQYNYVTFDDAFKGWVDFAAKQTAAGKPMTPDQARQLYMWQHGMQVTDSLGNKVGPDRKVITYGDKPDFSGEVSFSGGVPFIGKALGDLSFLASYRSDWQAFALPTFRDYYRFNNASLKLTSRITSTMKLGIEASYGETNTVAGSHAGGSDNDYATSGSDIMSSSDYGDYRYAWWTGAFVPFNIYNSMVGLSLDHALSNSTFYSLRISSVHIKNSADGWDLKDYRSKDILYHFGSYAVGNEPFNFYQDGGGNILTVGDNAVIGNGGGGLRDHGEVTTLNVKFDLTSQLDKNNQMKTGFEFVYDDLYTDFALIRYDADWETYHTTWSHFPIRFGAYIQDKLEFEGMIANIGVRLDYNDPNSDWFTADPYNKYFSRQYKDQLYTNAPTERAKGHLKISPRIGISHPISENVKLYFSYGHFYSMPSSTNMYVINMRRASDPITQVGNPNLELPKTIAYELGVDWNVADLALLHLAGYYKNVENQLNDVMYTNFYGTVNYTTWDNTNYADIRGFEVQLEKNFGTWISGFANYTYMVETHGNVGRNHYYENEILQDIQGYEDPNMTREQIRPIFRANVQFHTPPEWGPKIFGVRFLSDWIINPYATWQAGPYETYNPNNILGFGVSQNLQWKSNWNIDLRINKLMTIANVKMELYADINNVFNFKYMNNSVSSSNYTRAFASVGFGTNSDYEDYVRSLHLPLYNDPRFESIKNTAKGWYIPGDDQLGDIKSADKPYIHMPTRDFLIYRDLRYVTFGLRVNI